MKNHRGAWRALWTAAIAGVLFNALLVVLSSADMAMIFAAFGAADLSVAALLHKPAWGTSR